MNILINLLLLVHVLVCVLIVIAVLMQRPKNEGLGAAFGGGMTESLFGAQTTNVLATITRWLGVLFFGLTLLLSVLYARQGRQATGVQQKLKDSSKAIIPELPSAPAEKPAEVPAVPAVPAADSKTIEPAKPQEPAKPAPVEPSKPAPVQEKTESPEVPNLKVSAPELNPGGAVPAPAAGEQKAPQ